MMSATALPKEAPTIGTDMSGMKGFIHASMNEVLRPFADHFWHLEGRVDQLSKALMETDEKAKQETARLDETRTTMEGLKGEIAATQTHLDATREVLNRTIMEKAVLEKDNEEIKAHLKRCDAQNKENTIATKEVRQGLDSTNISIQELVTKVEEIQHNVTEFVDPTLRQALTSIAELDKRQSTTAQGLSQIKSSLENTTKSVERQSKLQQQQKEETAKTFVEVNDKLASLVETTRNLDTHMQAQGEKLSGVDAETHKLKATTNMHTSDLQSLKQRASKLETDLQALLDRFAPVEKGWYEFAQTIGSDDPNAGRRNVYDLLEELEVVVQKNRKAIEVLEEKKLDMQGPWISKVDNSLKDLKDQNLETGGKLQRMDADVQKLVFKQNSTTHLVDHTRKYLDSTSLSLHKAVEQLNDACCDMNGLSKKLTMTDDNVAKLQTGLEFVNIHFKDMRKGFQAIVPQRGQDRDNPNLASTDAVKPVILPKMSAR
eukprot:gnl/MRDRNA2_/MRDRNA2_106253_c0_seq1.p1 gnl/MRDRNA2_/MRDRNA2_106253_c0~~gnl/MRDRNA2_/MRDRNA2_106253_c0_seq1.p1  ORF type:complete len:488 (-),score=120.61 gnl/MRDRNA2_/MRDRNA2_106253_c0_seq1:20-1483(-)